MLLHLVVLFVIQCVKMNKACSSYFFICDKSDKIQTSILQRYSKCRSIYCAVDKSQKREECVCVENELVSKCVVFLRSAETVCLTRFISPIILIVFSLFFSPMFVFESNYLWHLFLYHHLNCEFCI